MRRCSTTDWASLRQNIKKIAFEVVDQFSPASLLNDGLSHRKNLVVLPSFDIDANTLRCTIPYQLFFVMRLIGAIRPSKTEFRSRND